MKGMKRILGMIVAVMLVIAGMPVGASAATGNDILVAVSSLHAPLCKATL